MKWILQVMLSVFALSCAAFASSPVEEAHRRLQVADAYTNPELAIPDELRTIFDPTAEQVIEKPSLGAGIIRVFQVDGEKYVIYGMRFGQAAKLSVGGSVEEQDKTVEHAIERELQEECFGQLPLVNITYAEQKMSAGGFQLEDGKIVSKGWGPYLIFFAIETGYNLAQLKEAVELMNINAGLHFPVATFFNEIEKLGAEHVSAQAQSLLQAFEEVNGKNSIVPLNPNAEAMLVSLVKEPKMLPVEGGFGFAKKYVHDYTEYSEFNLVKFADFMGLQIKKFAEEEIDLAYKLLGVPEGKL